MSNQNQPPRRDSNPRGDQNQGSNRTSSDRTSSDDGSQRDASASARSGSDPRADASSRGGSDSRMDSASRPQGDSRVGSSSPSPSSSSSSSKSESKFADALNDLADCIDQLARGSQADFQSVKKKLAEARESIKSCSSDSKSADAWRGGSIDDPAGVSNRGSSIRQSN